MSSPVHKSCQLSERHTCHMSIHERTGVVHVQVEIQRSQPSTYNFLPQIRVKVFAKHPYRKEMSDCEKAN